MEIGDSKENGERDFRMLPLYQAGAGPGFVGPEAYTIWGILFKKTKYKTTGIKLSMKMHIMQNEKINHNKL